MRWFGRAPFSPMCADDEVAHVPTPVGVPCSWCEEPFDADACGYFYAGQNPPAVHVECFVRQIVGSVGHQLRRCACFGGDEDDPPGVSRREAAQRAAALFEAYPPGR